MFCPGESWMAIPVQPWNVYLLLVQTCYCIHGFRFNVHVYTNLVYTCFDRIPLQCACVEPDYAYDLVHEIHGKENEGTSVDNAVFVHLYAQWLCSLMPLGASRCCSERDV